MGRCDGAAARLPGDDREDQALQALARSAAISGLATRHGVSRTLVHQQTHKACAALAGAFLPAAPDREVLFGLALARRGCARRSSG